MKLSAGGSSSPLPAVGMLLGMLLLGLAGFIVVSTPTSVGSMSKGSKKFLERRLMGFGYITTSVRPSSFDSSDSSSLSSVFEPSKSLESGSMESSDLYELGPTITKTAGGSMGWVTGSLLLQIIFAVLYQRMVVNKIVDTGKLDARIISDPGSNDFQNNILQCTKDPWVCAQGLFCPMVRIAHTNAVSNICGFWESLACMCCCTWLTVGMGPACLLMCWRQRLKSIMKLDDNILTDFFLTLLCPHLSLCQMATATDAAMGYQIDGCCEVKWTPQSYDGFADDH